MTFFRVVSAVLVSACWFVCASVAQNQNVTNTTTTTKQPANTTGTNNNTFHQGRMNSFGVTSFMIRRALYVLIGITVIGFLYFLIRAVRLKKPSQKKKYGLLSNYDDSVEMEAVDSDEDDTLYEARSLRR